MSPELEKLFVICYEKKATVLRFLLDRLSAVVQTDKGQVICLRYIDNEWI